MKTLDRYLEVIDIGRLKFLVFIPVVWLVVSCLYGSYATREIEKTLMEEQYVEVRYCVDTLAVAVEANKQRYWEDHELNIIASAEFLDARNQVFAAAYKPDDDGNLRLLTTRLYETSVLDPFAHVDINEIRSNQSGDTSIWYAPRDQSYREMLLHYRWMPQYAPKDEQYLVIAGVSKYSVNNSMSLWVATGYWLNILITFAINLCLMILIIQLGNMTKANNNGGDDADVRI